MVVRKVPGKHRRDGWMFIEVMAEVLFHDTMGLPGGPEHLGGSKLQVIGVVDVPCNYPLGMDFLEDSVHT